MVANRGLGVAGSLLLGLGLVVGVAAGIGLLLGFEPARLPDALLNIAAYKLAFLASGGLLAAGAIVVRYARREGNTTRVRPISEPAALTPGDEVASGARIQRPLSRAGRSERDRLT